MRTLACLTMGTIMMLTSRPALAEDPQPGKQTPASLEVTVGKGDDATKVTVNYLLYLPKDYGQGDKKSPLLLFLHGAGERGEDLDLVKVHGPPKLCETDAWNQPFVILSPQCPKNKRWDVAQMLALVDHAAGTLKIDRQRMYVSGLSMGGYGTWSLTAAHPKVFAAAVPICGGGDPSKADQLVDLAIWAFHGDKDGAVPLSRSQDMLAAIEKAGGNSAKLTIYPGVGHDSWTETYNNPDVYKWLLSHERKPPKQAPGEEN